MDAETLFDTRVGRQVLRLLAAVMESRLRYRFFGADKVLAGAGLRAGEDVREIGCGTGYFTLPAARLLGGRGSLVALDHLSASVAAVTAKVDAAGLDNVRVVHGDALDTGLESESFDAVLVFGVVPAPTLPLAVLLRELHRVLRPEGTLAVWPPSWVHRTIRGSGLFVSAGLRQGVMRYTRTGGAPA